MKITKSKILLGIILVLAVIVLAVWFRYSSLKNQITLQKNEIDRLNRYVNDLQIVSGLGVIGDVHLHADIAVYIGGKKIDLSQQKYQLKAKQVHVEDGRGDVVHVHVKGITIGHFLNSIGIRLNGGCIETDEGKFCNTDKNKIKFYVNGKLIDEGSAYILKDLDRILISYGDESTGEIQTQINSVTGNAKEFSNSEMG